MTVAAFERRRVYGGDPLRAIAALEESTAKAFTDVAAKFFGPWVPLTRNETCTVRPWDFLLADSSGASLAVLIPDPKPGGGWIGVVRKSASNAVTLRPLSSSVTINGAATRTITGAYGWALLVPISTTEWVALS